jgi:pimeloyl-ACP methyl ester carboxylesterase
MVRVLGLFLDRLGLGKVSIAGNSLGGYIAWNFALAQPDRVERLILVDPAGYPMRKVPLMIASAVLPGAGLLMPAWMPRALLARGSRRSMAIRSVSSPAWSTATTTSAAGRATAAR